MPTWEIYDHVDRRGRRVIEEWLEELNPKARGKCHAKIVMLRQFGGTLPKTLLSDTDSPLLKKLRIRGRINWRVLLCAGPISPKTEFTLIAAHYEKDDSIPKNAIEQAEAARSEIIAAPNERRVAHDFKRYEG